MRPINHCYETSPPLLWDQSITAMRSVPHCHEINIPLLWDQSTTAMRSVYHCYETKSSLIWDQPTTAMRPIHHCYEISPPLLWDQSITATRPIHHCYETNPHCYETNPPPDQFLTAMRPCRVCTTKKFVSILANIILTVFFPVVPILTPSVLHKNFQGLQDDVDLVSFLRPLPNPLGILERKMLYVSSTTCLPVEWMISWTRLVGNLSLPW